MNKNIIRINFEGIQENLNYNDMLIDLEFQIGEDVLIMENYIEENISVCFDEYCKIILENKLKDLENGYSIEVLGDTYISIIQ